MSNICLFSLYHSASRVSHSTPVCPCIYSCTGDYWWTSSHCLIRNTLFPPAFALFCFCLSICRAQDSEIISILTQALQCTFHTGIKSLVGYYIFKFYLIVCVCGDKWQRGNIFIFEENFNYILFNLFCVYACLLQHAGGGQRAAWLSRVSSFLPPGGFLGLGMVQAL